MGLGSIPLTPQYGSLSSLNTTFTNLVANASGRRCTQLFIYNATDRDVEVTVNGTDVLFRIPQNTGLDRDFSPAKFAFSTALQVRAVGSAITTGTVWATIN